MYGDRTRIEQTISNLMNNAVKFTPRNGFVHLSVTKEGHTAVIRVRDTGEGITKDEMRHIFEPYYQSERLRSSNPGLGVGLNLVQKIVEMHGGKISVASEALQGSEFTIRFKLENTAKIRNVALKVEKNS
jgi:signal transduction histidine kinase